VVDGHPFVNWRDEIQDAVSAGIESAFLFSTMHPRLGDEHFWLNRGAVDAVLVELTQFLGVSTALGFYFSSAGSGS
jgi:hypothetical protein